MRSLSVLRIRSASGRTDERRIGRGERRDAYGPSSCSVWITPSSVPDSPAIDTVAMPIGASAVNGANRSKTSAYQKPAESTSQPCNVKVTRCGFTMPENRAVGIDVEP